MDTLGVDYAEAGDFATAVAERALQDAPPNFADEIRRRLELYRKNLPYRQEKRSALITQFMPVKGR